MRQLSHWAQYFLFLLVIHQMIKIVPLYLYFEMKIHISLTF